MWQGSDAAGALRVGSAVKLLAVYALPALGLSTGSPDVAYGPPPPRRHVALVVHGATLLLWKSQTGTFFPFISTHAANYPVTAANLTTEWARYLADDLRRVGVRRRPSSVSCRGSRASSCSLRIVRDGLDRPDRLLLVFWSSFFLLLEFFPAGFSLDTYYTVPRIFRYLAPLSFLLAFHAAKLVPRPRASLATRRGRRPS